MTKKFALTLIVGVCLLAYPLTQLTFAATATPSASPTQNPSASPSAEEIKKSLQERIKKAIEENLNSSSSTTQNQTTPKLKGFVGTLNSISGNTISISTDHTLKQATISEDTIIVREGQNAKFESLKIGEHLIAMGDTTDDQTQTTYRLVLYEPPLSPYETLIVKATIKSINVIKNQIEIDSTPAFTQTLKLSTKLIAYDRELKPIDTDLLTENTSILATVLINKDKDTATLTQLVADLVPNQVATTPSKCGDGVCTTNSDSPESPETCPADCTKP